MENTWSKSDYFKTLSEEDGIVLRDPFSYTNNWKDDVSLLPDIGWGDLHTYLIDTSSPFTNASLKAYKSLKAYNFFVCGHVQDVYHHEILHTEFCCLKSKVSQRF